MGTVQKKTLSIVRELSKEVGVIHGPGQSERSLDLPAHISGIVRGRFYATDRACILLSCSKKLVLPVSPSSLAEHAHLSYHRGVGDSLKHDSTSKQNKNNQCCSRRRMDHRGHFRVADVGTLRYPTHVPGWKTGEGVNNE